jgi:hypothetical protein
MKGISASRPRRYRRGRFAGITIDHQAIEHRVMQAANFVFKCKKPTIGIGVDDFFEAKLMISNFF